MPRRSYQAESQLMISFQGAPYPKDVILSVGAGGEIGGWGVFARPDGDGLAERHDPRGGLS
ncbi:hypothetical protein LCM27_11150 [Ruegeria marisrubri]|uniref:hypothetical protein n=1 Tax=Ruegeria marisrubri TaxID=1685379 RepID=UPI001CD7B3EE|nr:hypothetical protein [Ruegeria marisrubri]MCA0906952.1 hypothetical protein [Ruegeria marisrubri]